jgi:hypothetical protein
VSLTGFQSALAQLIIDAEFSHCAKADIQDALGRYNLTALERRRLVAIAHDPHLGIARRIHRFFRINALLQSLPLTIRLLGHRRLGSLTESFWQLGAPRNYYYQREAARFGEFLTHLIECGELKDPYLLDIVRFELAALDLARSQQVKEDEVSEACGTNRGDWCPSLSPGYRLVVFEHEPGELLSCLEGGEEPKEIETGRYYLLLDGAIPQSIRLVPLLPEIGAILEHCDGKRNAEELTAQGKISLKNLQSLVTAGYLK